jgi:hypothetical protein
MEITESGAVREINEAISETDNKFVDFVGNYFSGVWFSYQALKKNINSDESRKIIEEGKEEFFGRLEEFKKNGYKQTERINTQSLEELLEFKDKDWTDESVMKKLYARVSALCGWIRSYEQVMPK